MLASTVHPAPGECIPGGICAAFERDDRAGEALGTQRKKPSGASLTLLTLVARKGLRAVLNDYLEGYNTRRLDQGHGMNGRTPVRAFNDGMPKTSNTEVTSQTKTAKLKAV